MVKITTEVTPEMMKQIERTVREGWFTSPEVVFREALEQFVNAKTYLGDSPLMLHRFAADALNESKPETALKFVGRAIALLSSHKVADLALYQSLVELRVQVLMVMGRNQDALTSLEEAQEKLPNNPVITRWIERLHRKG